MTLNEKILAWAKERDLLKPENANRQFLKLVEEVGELASAMAKNNSEGIVDALGDIQVVLIILARQLDYSYTMCLEIAYETIKNRTGKTVDGVFVKDV